MHIFCAPADSVAIAKSASRRSCHIRWIITWKFWPKASGAFSLAKFFDRHFSLDFLASDSGAQKVSVIIHSDSSLVTHAV